MALSLQKQNNELDQISSNLMQLEPAKTKSKEIIEMESRIIDNLSQLDIKRDSLENMKKTLQEKQSRIREKNMFSETDGQWDMWTKIITLARYKLYYDAIDSIDEYENKVKGKDPLTPVYTASVKKYFQLLSSYWDKLEPFPNIAGEDLSKLGIVVLGFENNIAHSVLKVGDIILTRDNKPVHDVDDYNQIAMSSTNRDFILLRLSQGGELIQTELTGSSSDPRISLVALNATME